MLGLTRGGRERSGPPRATSTTQSRRLSFGGVAFELLADGEGDAFSPSSECLAYCIPGFDPRATADVVCAVHADPSMLVRSDGQDASDDVRSYASTSREGALLVCSRSLHAELESVGPRRYLVTARIAPGHAGVLALLRGIAAAIVHREGGVVLHAAAAVLEGRAVLFVGPSGVGKSTALRLAKGSYCFAHDHVAVVRNGDKWLAWGLPGGTTTGAPMAAGVVYPLSAVLRVRQSIDGYARAVKLAGAEALFAVRESVEWADDSLGAEDMHLRAASELASHIPIGSITTVLGGSTSAALREFLSASQGKRYA